MSQYSFRACLIALSLSLSLLCACSKPLPDEKQIRLAMAKIQLAADEKKLAQLMHYLHDGFTGKKRMSRRDFQALVFYHFQNYPRVRTYVSNIDIRIEQNVALVSCHLLVTASHKTIPERGRLYRIDSAWQKNGDKWQVKQADWGDVVEEWVR